MRRDDEIEAEFEAYVRRVVEPVVAFGWRKGAMREELMAHLLQRYQEQLECPEGESLAICEVVARMGDDRALSRELQDSIGLVERLWVQLLSRKGASMRRWIWLAAMIVVLLGTSIVLPALGRHKELGIWKRDMIEGLVVGAAMMLAGFATIGYGIRRKMGGAARSE